MGNTFGRLRGCISVYGELCEIPIVRNSSFKQRQVELWIVETTLGLVVRINPYELHVNDVRFYEQIYASSHHRRDKFHRSDGLHR